MFLLRPSSPSSVIAAVLPLALVCARGPAATVPGEAGQTDPLVPVAGVVVSVPDEETFTISFDPKEPLHLEDRVCASRPRRKVACGDVVLTTASSAVVRVLTVRADSDLAEPSARPRGKAKSKSATRPKLWRQPASGDAAAAPEARPAEPAPPIVVPAPSDAAAGRADRLSRTLELRIFPVVFRRQGDEPKALEFIDGMKAAPAVGATVLIKKGGRALCRGTVTRYTSDDGLVSIRSEETYQSDYRWIAGAVYNVTEIADAGALDATKSLTFLLGLGFSFDSYRETSHPDFSESTVRPRAEIGYRLSEAWRVALAGSMTALAVAHDAPPVLRLLAIDTLASYRLPFRNGSVGVEIHGGWLYRTMFATQSAFGVKDLAGPVIFPTVDIPLSPRAKLLASVRYSPVLDKLSPTLSDRELGARVSLDYRLLSGRTASAALELTSLDYATTYLRSRLTSFSVQVGYQW